MHHPDRQQGRGDHYKAWRPWSLSSIAFALPDGALLARTLPGQSGESTAGVDDARRALDDIDPLPLYLRDPGQSAFSAWLPELDAIYIRINRNYDKALPDKLDEILAGIRERTPRNAIVDLRLNGGGNYELTAPFAEALPGLLPDVGRLVLIVGHRTFSAAIVTAAILKVRAGAQAIVVGEKIGDDLQFWSEGGFLTLPNSGMYYISCRRHTFTVLTSKILDIPPE